ncbi:tetratricopeptide repeat protein [Leptospira inadai serovar Lyme str. 10]|uniref:Tetratricopeptide repeat protein n=2 Tax=Leptospira inadai serovar Lyme TaxID=293084 RepID=V6HF21_9LEPT|nr:tetratricopeptide repeat protein [Leptospira inadai]EQA38093.1 tetratricopeptide repeat protein [Leptospira inadai serovar Lyme str. 10]PNV76524.1 hypothetical protein BES34_002740 [Leptospira inadai serovar Lyme]
MDEIRTFFLRFAIIILIYCNSFSCGGLDETEKKKLYLEAYKYYELNNRAEAERTFRRIYESDPSYQDTALFIGKIHYFNRDFKEAEKYFMEARELFPENLSPLLWLIKCQFAQQKDKTALKNNIQDYLKRDSENLDVLYIKGRISEEAGDLQTAILAYTQLKASSAKVALAYIRLSEIYKGDSFKTRREIYRKKIEALSRPDGDF